MGTATRNTWSRGADWLPIILAATLVLLLTLPIRPPWARMWFVAFAVYASCKWLTWRRTPHEDVSLGRQLGYLLAWPGMDAAGFFHDRPERPGTSELRLALAKLFLGAVLVECSYHLIAYWPLAAGWVGMAGVALYLHCGLFHLLSLCCGASGVSAPTLMNRPLAAVSVNDFWGRRWNVAFRDLTERFVFRPLAAPLGPRGALTASFAWSGLVHDVILSVPAGGGYGGPTLFFLLQAAAIVSERSAFGRRLGLGHGMRGWLFTASSLLAPAGLLFHAPFLHNVLLPFLAAVHHGAADIWGAFAALVQPGS